MKQEEEILSKYGKDSGMRVPDGYFADLERNILNSLPAYPEKKNEIQLSRWQRVRPYVYLAAMFCGIWLMMKVFHTATQPLTMGLDNPPEALVELIDGDWDYDVQYRPYIVDFDSEDEDFIMSYDNMSDFEKDFGYKIKPEYN